MNKRQIVIFDGIIHEYLKLEKQFDTWNKPQIVRPRFTAILQKPENKIQAESKLLKLYELNFGLKWQLGGNLNIVNWNTPILEYDVILSNSI